MKSTPLGIVCLLLSASAACTDLESTTNLVPEGPPMIRQVRLREVNRTATGTVTNRRVFAFGTHPLALTNDYPALGPNAMATAAATSQSFRIIMDELLVGNYLEEIACRAPVDDDAYDFVLPGTTPDDVARCSVALDVLPSSCPGTNEHSVCICKNDGGCGDIPKGAPVGVLDVNQDGAADDTRFIAGAVGIRCNNGTIDVPLDLNQTYWNPSGDQNRPAMGGFEVLGPALVVVPNGPLPTNQRCRLAFSPAVVDKQGNQVCAPPGGGDLDTDGVIEGTCTPGNVDAFEFLTQALEVTPSTFTDGEMGVDPAQQAVLAATAPIAPGSLGAVTVTQGATPLSAGAYTVSLPQPTAIRIVWTNPLQNNTTYTIRISTALTDTFGQPLVQPANYTFTTAP